MDINSNSFFFRRYMGYGRTDTFLNKWPNTFCQLAWRFVKRTFFFLLILHTLISTIFVTATRGLFLLREPGSPLNLMGWNSTFLDALFGMPAFLVQVVLLIIPFLVVFALLFGGSIALKEKIQKKVGKDNVATATIARIRDKTCVLINIKDDSQNEKDSV